jgi:ion channel-forming bestrophin family protein
MLLDKRIPLSYIFNKIRYDFFAILMVGLAAQVITTYYDHLLPKIPLAIPTFLGTAISVLLSFKMNQSYDRWWEARKIWGAIVNDSRTLVVQLGAFLPEGEASLVKRLAYRQIAWCYSLGQSLRGQDPLKGLSAFLEGNDEQDLLQHNNKPLALVSLSSQDIRRLKEKGAIDVWSQVQLDNTLVRLVDSMGRAERIKSTIFPATYRLFLHFIIYIFVITLSLALWELKAVYELPLLLLISSCFLLIEKSAYHLQDPFSNRPSDTAMTAIARTIEINIRQLLREKDVPPPVQPQGFYVM